MMETGYLKLKRLPGESIIIDGTIKVTVVSVEGKRVKLSIVAPKDVSVHREEVFLRIMAEKENASA